MSDYDKDGLTAAELKARLESALGHNRELLERNVQLLKDNTEKDKLLESQGDRITAQSEILSRRAAKEAPITEHEGKKYLREIFGATDKVRFVEVEGRKIPVIEVDVYCVLDAFRVHSAPVAHAVKKCLACGERGKGDALSDLNGVLAAISRAVEQHKQKGADK